MDESALESVLVKFFADQSAHGAKLLETLEATLDLVEKTEPVYDAIEGQIKFMRRFQQGTREALEALKAEARPSTLALSVTPIAPVETAQAPTCLIEEQASPAELGSYEQELVTAYNEQPSKWTRTFKPSGFGAENVNEIWVVGGEPKFTRKEGGIYHLVEANGVFYVVPEPGLRLQEGYFRSEGLCYLFEVTGDNTESEPLISLISAAKVQEAGGRWNILSKGEIRGRV